MLEEFIYSLIENRKKIFWGAVFFVISILFIAFGLFSTIFIVVMTIIGYHFGDMDNKNIIVKLKNMLTNLLNKIDTN
ncbi:DUF2273 domain-containing protein [Fusobacterium perfoetens]|uniref:DUF2273 domain-containing protein n=1 Tax=Fusobacterium perfoetens TaxID=852 RepID=UPI0006858FCB|nr:DUF2273 domain-containing protein [Fusobacterium perfoetens]MCI6152808.1 DUF2273 domain-containing protein [Fusobacterium perfoetens]MDY3236702.1 DUF2273 domain-containing protein [Fusobacterium perfoetens]